MSDRNNPSPNHTQKHQRKRKSKLCKANVGTTKKKAIKGKDFGILFNETKCEMKRTSVMTKKLVYGVDSMFMYYMSRHIGLRSPQLTKSWTRYLPISLVGKFHTKKSPSKCGAIFNLEFSPDNKYLVAACENRSISIFDPCIHKKVLNVSNSHNDCVNGITFLNARMFATCSDDTTIALWDIRKLQSKVCSLAGHTNWVKSMNYIPETNMLISSAFDDTIRTWNINEFSENNTVKADKLIDIPYLTRTALSYDFKNFFVATTTGVLLVIHNVDFSTISMENIITDTESIQNTNLLMESEPYNDEHESSINKVNRIEYLKDFPMNSKPWCIASLQIHPFGFNVLSRYSCNDESEWTVVHNIPHGENKTINKSRSHLQSYIEEPNLAGGYIKEVCYNHDGTIICSPFGNGIRLLGFNSICDSSLDCLSEKAQELVELKSITSHTSPVLTTRFANHIPILASGCLSGKVSFYQPRI